MRKRRQQCRGEGEGQLPCAQVYEMVWCMVYGVSTRECMRTPPTHACMF